jgi:hypothetical protein
MVCLTVALPDISDKREFCEDPRDDDTCSDSHNIFLNRKCCTTSGSVAVLLLYALRVFLGATGFGMHLWCAVIMKSAIEDYNCGQVCTCCSDGIEPGPYCMGCPKG